MGKGIAFCLLVMTLLLPGTGFAISQSNDTGTGVIVERNLFNPNRSIPPPPKPRALKPVAQPVPPPPPPPPKFELAGVVKVEGESSMALLQEPRLTNGNPMVLNLGDSLGGYKLVAIEHDRVRLESETGTVTVLLYDPTKTHKTGVAASLPARQVATPQVPAAPPAGDLRRRLRAPALQAPPAPQRPAVSAESPAANVNPEPSENKAENVLGIFRKAFEPLKGQIPMFLEPSESQGQQGQGQEGEGQQGQGQ